MLSGKLWPAHPHPYNDELLSSWLVRIAHANGLKIQTFCDHEFGKEHQLWNRDIDRLAPPWLLSAISKHTGIDFEVVRKTTLSTYAGILHAHQHPTGQQRWILPLQLFHRKRLGFGLQFCPNCLAEDVEPYFRRAWRVALFTFCPKHLVMLSDKCPHCSMGIAFHRVELGHRQQGAETQLNYCWHCGFDLGKATTPPPTNAISSKWIDLVTKLSQSNWPHDQTLQEEAAVIHQLCKVLTFQSKNGKQTLLQYTAQMRGQTHVLKLSTRYAIEGRGLAERHFLIDLAWWLLEEWPIRLTQAWKAKAVRYNLLTKDFEDIPCWYKTTVEAYNRRRTKTIGTQSTVDRNG